MVARGRSKMAHRGLPEDTGERTMPGLKPLRGALYFLAAALAIVGLALILLSGVEPPRCPPGMLCIDPGRTTGFVFDMGAAGWRPVAREERTRISYLVSEGRAEYKFQPQGFDLYEFDPQGFYLGEKIASLPTEWWRPVKRGRR
jgi:hypothetical protein